MNSKLQSANPGWRPLIISSVSVEIFWDPDDEVGRSHKKYFESNSYKIEPSLRIRPGSSISDLKFLKNLTWNEDALEVSTGLSLQSAESNRDNPFLSKPSALFGYRINVDLDISKIVEDSNVTVLTSPELYVNEFIQNFCIAIDEWPYGETRTNDFEYMNGFFVIPFEIIQFMGDTYDVHNE